MSQMPIDNKQDDEAEKDLLELAEIATEQQLDDIKSGKFKQKKCCKKEKAKN